MDGGEVMGSRKINWRRGSISLADESKHRAKDTAAHWLAWAEAKQAKKLADEERRQRRKQRGGKNSPA
jgi:hypothetical protein